MPNIQRSQSSQGRSSMTPNIYAIMADCIQRGVTAGLRRYDIENVLLQGDIESAIWLELDSFFTFDEEKWGLSIFISSDYLGSLQEFKCVAASGQVFDVMAANQERALLACYELSGAQLSTQTIQVFKSDEW